MSPAEAAATSRKCEECGGNCYPEHGRHPAGCEFGGQVCGYWTQVPGCKLDHVDIGRRVARNFLDSMRIIEVQREPR